MKIKGMIIAARKEFVNENFGQGAWEKVMDGLSQEDRQLIGESILSSQWYPFEIGDHIDKAIVKVLGKGDNLVFEQLGAKSAQKSLAKEHRTFLAPGNPQAFMKKTGSIYKFYYDTGYREYQATGPNSGVITTHEAKTFSVPDCLTVIGWYKEALKMCGARDIKMIEVECRATGGTVCRYKVEWNM
ncbi:MAG: hypothetical protein KJ620_02530 [Candidatus Edwardsbacteria bacterium]|nr:hypothetical protein [Candidatus Edwardsbacteria bacterium]MBU1577371.1 hypothetical protein [Candidatus Edwardsbacteria bacterium]MBU2463189.1 hypothetical protein [Candidatus Edwardsbacteria bacterium]MBU2594160.1 hypothetical protein [Candidatus Edwardsbacteria bacterium]